MPKLKPFIERRGNVDWEIPVYVTTDGQFYCKPPESLVAQTSLREGNRFPNTGDMEAAIREAIDKFLAVETSYEYILVYEFKEWTPGRYSGQGAGMSLAFAAYRRTTVGKLVGYNYIRNTYHRYEPTDEDRAIGVEGLRVGEEINSRYAYRDDREVQPGYGVPELPLTAENLTFFKEATKALDELGDRLRDFLEKDTLTAFLASNAPKQLPGLKSEGESEEE